MISQINVQLPKHNGLETGFCFYSIVGSNFQDLRKQLRWGLIFITQIKLHFQHTLCMKLKSYEDD